MNMIRKWRITVQEKITIGSRREAQLVEKYLFVWARSAAGARRAIVDTGYRGKIVSIEKELL